MTRPFHARGSHYAITDNTATAGSSGKTGEQPQARIQTKLISSLFLRQAWADAGEGKSGRTPTMNRKRPIDPDGEMLIQ